MKPSTLANLLLHSIILGAGLATMLSIGLAINSTTYWVASGILIFTKILKTLLFPDE